MVKEFISIIPYEAGCRFVSDCGSDIYQDRHELKTYMHCNRTASPKEDLIDEAALQIYCKPQIT